MTSLDEYMKSGYECMSQNNVAQAIEYFQAALQSAPNNEEAKMCLYMAYNRLGKPQYAKKYHDGEIPTNALPLDTSYIKWHKEQVIEKWGKIFNGRGIFKDENKMISCQLLLFPESGTDNKHVYDLLITPLNYINVDCSLPVISSIFPIEVQKEVQKNLQLSSLSERIYFRVKESDVFKYSNGSPNRDHIAMEGPINTTGVNSLEKTEYEYYRLWACHYLGLWQWEKRHPFANIRDTVGKKFEIMGVDDEMNGIAELLHDNTGIRVPSNKISIMNEHFYELNNDAELYYHDCKRGYLTDLRLSNGALAALNGDGLNLKKRKGYYGDYFVDRLSFCCNGETCSTVIFGSSDGQGLQAGDTIRYIFGGVGVIMD